MLPSGQPYPIYIGPIAGTANPVPSAVLSLPIVLAGKPRMPDGTVDDDHRLSRA